VAVHRLGLLAVLDEAGELAFGFDDVADLLRRRVEGVVEALIGIAPPAHHLRIAEEGCQPFAIVGPDGAQPNTLAFQHVLAHPAIVNPATPSGSAGGTSRPGGAVDSARP
jgi:hypothetical protein